MKYNNYISKFFLIAGVAMAATSCQEDITYGDYTAPQVGDGTPVIYVSDADGNTQTSAVDMRDGKDVQLFVNTTTPAAADNEVSFAYDPATLDQYNAANGTEFEAVPETMVSFPAGNKATLAAGKVQSEPLTVTLTSDGSLDPEKTYVVPLKVSANGAAALAAQAQTRLIFVRDLTAMPNCFKTWVDADGVEHEGIKIFSVMEINDTNPLNNLRYTLENSGKYMVDALVMFSGNINYNAETGRVYFYANPNIQYCLDNRETVLKPLQDRGMKVIMGVMCNHDRACISNLNDETAKLFAQELKALCDAYQLDGIFWDDEYCSPINPPPPGFVSRSRDAWSRLAYETWKLQPERWNVAYGYSQTFYANAVDGVDPGTFISYCLPDYSSSYSDYTGHYAGMQLSQMGGCSMEFAQGRWAASENTLRNMRNAGYGAMMVFAMDPFRNTGSGQDGAMGKLARAFYDDEVVVDPYKYEKTW